MSDAYKIEKTGTYQNDDKSTSTFLVAGDEITMDEARAFGLVKDERAKVLQDAADQRKAQGAHDFEDVGQESQAHKDFVEAQEQAVKDANVGVSPTTRNKGAAPENRAQ